MKASVRVTGAAYTGVVEIDLSSTLKQFKETLSSLSQGIPPSKMKLLLGGKILKSNMDSSVLSSLNFKNESKVIFMVEGDSAAARPSSSGGAAAAAAAGTGAAAEGVKGLSVLRRLEQAYASDRERDKRAEELAALAEKLAGRTDGGLSSMQQYHFTLANQSGEEVTLPDADRKALVKALSLHDKARRMLNRAEKLLRRSSGLMTDNMGVDTGEIEGGPAPGTAAVSAEGGDAAASGGGGVVRRAPSVAGDGEGGRAMKRLNSGQAGTSASASAEGGASSGAAEEGGGGAGKEDESMGVEGGDRGDVGVPGGHEGEGGETVMGTGGEGEAAGSGDVPPEGGDGGEMSESTARKEREKQKAKDLKQAKESFEMSVQLLLIAEDSLKKVNPKFLEGIDNDARLKIDLAWALFKAERIEDLPKAEDALEEAEAKCERVFGKDFERAKRVRGSFCAEKALLVRTLLLRGAAAVVKRESDEATRLLERCASLCSEFDVDLELVSSLMMMGFDERDARRAVRAICSTEAGRFNTRDGQVQSCLEFLNWMETETQLAAEREIVRRGRERRARRLGRTRGGALVDVDLVDRLMCLGTYTEKQAAKALKETTNDFNRALDLLQAEASRAATREQLEATMVSIGFTPEAARLAVRDSDRSIDQVYERMSALQASSGAGAPGAGLPELPGTGAATAGVQPGAEGGGNAAAAAAGGGRGEPTMGVAQGGTQGGVNGGGAGAVQGGADDGSGDDEGEEEDPHEADEREGRLYDAEFENAVEREFGDHEEEEQREDEDLFGYLDAEIEEEKEQLARLLSLLEEQKREQGAAASSASGATLKIGKPPQ
uniref:Ubiquitin-like domain-containing protein n=1 Tax=Chromera velia CCMP2878 TaxID=1169474 RepID=A0A0G4HHC2_9ALVE|eukprot:Cvel_27640.t1-p1 / transcript=Cvel_27640.t1 / gene=Cvel_27640 / organism=Chromera_velia_CCMP2878 / gene_product=NEDD8 ultimate buster 1, putative / transcript_product=NEDD8 ultimate buster 1, putative / location=Cvel_scaffold3479:5754-11333(+) / protein_length=832 / sequence_SO=supercontig / SO=protein_coding / is_pseudo=false